MRIDLQKLTVLSGVLGALLLAVCCTVPAGCYRGPHGEGFSFLNHFMSELGVYRVSPWAVVYNSGIFIGGTLLVMTMVGCGWFFRSRLGLAATWCGVFSGAACALLGFFPLNRLAVHLSLAYAFFFGWPVTVTLFCILLHRSPHSKFTRPLLVLGGVSFALFAVFLALPFLIGLRNIWALDLRTYVRPAFLFPALLEWLMFFSVLAWILLACADLARRQRPAATP